jgi:hypothetical protein
MSVDVEALMFAVLSPISPGHVWNTHAADSEISEHIVFTRIDVVPATTLANGAPLENSHYQIDIYKEQRVDAYTLATAVKNAMAGASFVNIRTNEYNGYEDTVKLHRCALDYSVWA